MLKAAEVGQQQGKVLLSNLQTKYQKTKLEMDSRGASPELLELLLQGHSKTLALKALGMNSNNVELSLAWLEQQKEAREQVAKYQHEERQRMIQEKTAGLKKASEKTLARLTRARSTFKAKTHRKTQKEKVDELVNGLEHELLRAGDLDLDD